MKHPLTASDPDSFDRMMGEAEHIISEWDNWYVMPHTDAVCAAFDAIDAALARDEHPNTAWQHGRRFVPHSLACFMADLLWRNRLFPTLRTFDNPDAQTDTHTRMAVQAAALFGDEPTC